MRVYISAVSWPPRYAITKTAVGYRSVDVAGEIEEWAPLGEYTEWATTRLYVRLRAPSINLEVLLEKCGKP